MAFRRAGDKVNSKDLKHSGQVKWQNVQLEKCRSKPSCSSFFQTALRMRRRDKMQSQHFLAPLTAGKKGVAHVLQGQPHSGLCGTTWCFGRSAEQSAFEHRLDAKHGSLPAEELQISCKKCVLQQPKDKVIPVDLSEMAEFIAVVQNRFVFLTCVSRCQLQFVGQSLVWRENPHNPLPVI